MPRRKITSDNMHFPELLLKLKRGPQVILPKDIGMILAFSGAGKETFAVDAGAGSGWLAVSLGNVCKKVVSYERRPEFAEMASGNVKRAGLSNVEIRQKDVFEGIEEKEVDLVTLDLADAEKAVPHAAGALKQGGVLVGYLPHVEQVKRFVDACNASGLKDVFTLEAMVRQYLVREQGIRPENTGLWHTAYLVFAKK